MESWIVYDLATGEELFARQGGVGMAAYQWLPEGAAVAVVPAAVVATLPRDWAPLKAQLDAAVDAEAEAVRARYVTALPAQVGTYLLKEPAARAWLADSSASTAMLQREATARGMTLDELANEVIAKAEAWAILAGAIEGLRFTAKVRIAAAATIGAIVEAAVIDWEKLHEA